ncbi:TetR/AcrR family transcriptional regulator [Streptomyces sp. CA-132043]|uniref:TetR/AcrR family transcriptional regulator n=1 Tax=Streptomyces sp. CA-132043 TaxID=3240048 RepID=UPI003D8D5867
MTPSTSGRELRADARLNREQIIAAARDLLAERGPDVPAEEVARRAGVGTGTLYRRFPDRQALMRAVAFDGFHRVVAIARTAEDEEPDAWRALSRFVHQAGTELRLATWLSVWFATTWAELQEDPRTAGCAAFCSRSSTGSSAVPSPTATCDRTWTPAIWR